ncbi:MAG: peroxiredoxin family protein [Acidobacteria bacterium]|nr:peroxiredoxin family protein [Acidobacteriota bacterium]
MTRKILMGICVVALLLSNAALLWKTAQMRKTAADTSAAPTYAAFEKLMFHSFPVSPQESIVLDRAHARYVVLFFFSPADCAACLPELSDLNRLVESENSLQVYAIMSYATFDEAEQTKRNFGLRFSILQDPDGKEVERLGLAKTPWKMVISLRERRILYQDPPTITQEERELFLRRVLALTAL